MAQMSTSDISMDLRANRSRDVTIYRGEPIIFSISIRNWRAFDAASHNKSLEMLQADLERNYKAGKITDAEYEKQLDSLRKEIKEIKGYQLGSTEAPWTTLLKFLRDVHNAWKPLGWPLKILSQSPEEPTLVIDDKLSLYVEFDMGSSEVESMAPGQYTIKCALEKGEVLSESNSVIVRITHRQDRHPSEEKLLSIGRYFLARNKPSQVFSIVERIFRLNPRSIDALVLKGEAEEASGNIQAALETYRQAMNEWYAQGLARHEAPRYIMSRINRLSMKT